MANNNQLTIVDENRMAGIANEEKMRGILKELDDIDDLLHRAMGHIKIGSGGSRAFSILEVGEEAPDVAKEIVGSILYSHNCNAYWSRPMEEAGNDKTPDCSSIDGISGTDRETGEIISCKGCPHNKYGSDPKGNNGKACKNMRRLYILRETDAFPMILSLPPTALRSFGDYRINIGMKRMLLLPNVLTQITLGQKKNKSDIEYSAPVFKALGEFPPSVCEQLRKMADAVREYAKSVRITADDYAADAGVERQPAPASGFMPVNVDEEALPF